MARLEGFEPPTARFVAEYSIQLSYRRIICRCGCEDALSRFMLVTSINMAEKEGLLGLYKIPRVFYPSGHTAYVQIRSRRI